MDKAAIRKAMRARRHALGPDEVRALSRAAQEHILEDPHWQNAASVGLYVAVRNETDARLLAEAAWDTGKRVFLPYTPAGVPGIMRFLPCASGQALAVNHFGIPEPDPETCPLPEQDEWVPEIVIAPGVAFDREGHRLGSGGGYYDRLFARHSMHDALRIGLAYSFQIVDRLPADAWDTPMHALATEEGLVWL